MKRVLHVGFGLPQTNERIASYAKVLSQASDWIRYTPSNWLVWTSRTPIEWADLLKPHMVPNDTVLIVYVDLNGHNGWQQKEVWEWLSRVRYDTNYSD